MSKEIHKILVVIDGDLNFKPDDNASLSPMLSELSSEGWFIPFSDKSHFFVVTEMRLGSKRKGKSLLHNILAKYSQLWLFGAKGFGADKTKKSSLEPEEIAGIKKLMDTNKLGVFATGDHYDIGTPLCGDIPRVRFMRRWRTSTDESGEEKNMLPKEAGVTSILTHSPSLVIGGFSDEDDDPTPKRIWTSSYKKAEGKYVPLYSHPVCFHPYLYRIGYLPDHMHEGVCTDAQLTDDNYSEHEEIKKDFNNDLSKCQIVAWSVHQIPSPTEPKKPEFHPCISVYDADGVGRIVTDSTFHHWIYKNIKGFQQTSNQTLAWQHVRQYPRSVAAFLARIEEPENEAARIAIKLRIKSRVNSALARFRLTNSFADFKKLGQELLDTANGLHLKREKVLQLLVDESNQMAQAGVSKVNLPGGLQFNNLLAMDEESKIASAFISVLKDR